MSRPEMGLTPILVVAPTPPPVHGVSRMTALLLRGLSRSERRVIHVDSRDVRDRPTINRFDLGKAILSLRLVARAVLELRRHPGAALYLPISQSRWALIRDGLCLLAARGMRRQRIVHLHGGALQSVLSDRRALRAFVQATLAGETFGWVLTDGLRSQFAGLIPDRAISVIPNGVPDPGPRVPGTDAHRATRLIYLSNIFPGKGQGLFLSALDCLSDHRNRLEIMLAGGGDQDMVARVTARIDALRAEGWNIRYQGPFTVEEGRRALQWADILVMTPDQVEGQPLVILEALAAGCAVIATSQGGIRETITGVEGRLVAPRPADIAGAVRMLGAPEVLRAAQVAARERYERNYTEERFVSRLNELTGYLD